MTYRIVVDEDMLFWNAQALHGLEKLVSQLRWRRTRRTGFFCRGESGDVDLHPLLEQTGDSGAASEFGIIGVWAEHQDSLEVHRLEPLLGMWGQRRQNPMSLQA